MADFTVFNLTPHDITLFMPDGKEILFPVHLPTVRAVTAPQQRILLQDYPGWPVSTRQVFTSIENLPDKDDHVDIVVSRVVAEAMQEMDLLRNYRGHVFVPDTGPQNVVRDASGRILGVKNLELWSR